MTGPEPADLVELAARMARNGDPFYRETGETCNGCAGTGQVWSTLALGGRGRWSECHDCGGTGTARVGDQWRRWTYECLTCGRVVDPDLEPSPGERYRCGDCWAAAERDYQEARR